MPKDGRNSKGPQSELAKQCALDNFKLGQLKGTSCCLNHLRLDKRLSLVARARLGAAMNEVLRAEELVKAELKAWRESQPHK